MHCVLLQLMVYLDMNCVLERFPLGSKCAVSDNYGFRGGGIYALMPTPIFTFVHH